jgi:hypothetical protein
MLLSEFRYRSTARLYYASAAVRPAHILMTASLSAASASIRYDARYRLYCDTLATRYFDALLIKIDED